MSAAVRFVLCRIARKRLQHHASQAGVCNSVDSQQIDVFVYSWMSCDCCKGRRAIATHSNLAVHMFLVQRRIPMTYDAKHAALT
jgi:hypothetical protein